MERLCENSKPSCHYVGSRKHYGPLAFWCLNHQLEQQELIIQIDELKAKGFAGFFMHARVGLLTPYGSDDWYAAIQTCIKHAKNLGLEAWLYDEDNFPSGAAGGRVIWENPNWRASHLEFSSLCIDEPGEYFLDLEPGALVGAYYVQGKTIQRVDGATGTVRTEWESFLCDWSYYPPYSYEGTPHWRGGAGGEHYRIQLRIDEVPGILLGVTRNHRQHNFPDLLNSEAVACFLRVSHEEYHKRFGGEFGKTVPGIFTDESKAMGPFAWSHQVPGQFLELTGGSLHDVLPHLILNIDEQTPYIRWAYNEAIAKLFHNAYIQQVAEYCTGVGLLFTGHMSPEEDPIGQVSYVPGLLSDLKRMDIPGCDLIGAWIGDRRRPLIHLSPKMASSAAHLAGKKTVLSEAFAVTDWLQDMAFMGKVTNWLYALGVNMLVTHSQFYSIDGLRKREAPPSQFFHCSYWEHFNAFSQYVENLSRLLSEGTHTAPLLVYYPAETFMALAEVNDPPVSERALSYRKQLGDLIHGLLVKGYDFDLIDAASLSELEVRDGKVSIDEEVFDALVLFAPFLRCDAAQNFERLEHDGALIIHASPECKILGESRICEAGQANRATDLFDALAKSTRPLFQADGELIGHQRKTDKGPVLFLVNNGDEDFKGRVCPSFAGPYEIVDIQAGRVFSCPDPLILGIPAGRGVVLRRSADEERKPVYRTGSDWSSLLDLSAGWNARMQSDNCLILNEYRVRVLDSSDDLLNQIKVEMFGSAPFVDLLSPAIPSVPTGNIMAFHTDFEWMDAEMGLHLVRETQLTSHAGKDDGLRFFVNGQEVSDFVRCRRYDSYNLEANIQPLLHNGRNTLVIVWQPEQSAPLPHSALPCDAVRLFGDFHVEFPWGRLKPATLSPRPEYYPLPAAVPPSQFGHAQYGGIVSYSRDFQIQAGFERVALCFEKVYESAEIRINDESIGVLWQEPFLLEFDPRILRQGGNHIEVRCSTSPGNYLQGLNRPAGFFGQVSLCH